MSSSLQRWLPFLQWWPRVSRSSLRADLIAGLTGSLILVPQGVAFATIAGMPPEYGLYAAMLPAIVSALWGSSWHLVSGPTTAISIVVFATMSPLAEPGSAHYIELVLTLTFLIGVIKLILGLLRLGVVVNFVSQTVIVGFTSGAAVLIAVSQVKNFFGLPIARGTPAFEVLLTLFRHSGDISGFVLGVALSTVLVSLTVKRWRTRWPHMILALIAGSLIAEIFNHAYGVQNTHLDSIGALDIGFPPLSSPAWQPEILLQMLPIALAVALLSLTEAVAVSRAIAIKTGQRFDSNQEFIGQGLSNITGAFFSGYASSGSFNRSGLNYVSGAQTPLSSVFSAVFLLAIMSFLGSLAVHIPTAAMAGILFVVAWGLIDATAIRAVLRSGPQEGAVLVLTFLATLTIQLQYAVFCGVGLSLVLYLRRTSQPLVEDVKPVASRAMAIFSAGTGLPDCPQLKIVRIHGSIFFGAVNHLQKIFEDIDAQNPAHVHLLVAASDINFVDASGAHWLAQEARRRRALGGGLYIFQMQDEPLAMLRRGVAYDVIGAENFFTSDANLMSAIKARLNPLACAQCTVRVFAPCR
jgi:SulP family sulfate permease